MDWVGYRLALLARGHVYGEGILCDAPVAEAVNFENNQIRITFKHAGEGLYIQGEKVIPFLAKADGNDIIIRLVEIINGKVSVEFAQGKWYRVNLYNSADIPAVPFKSEVTI